MTRCWKNGTTYTIKGFEILEIIAFVTRKKPTHDDQLLPFQVLVTYWYCTRFWELSDTSNCLKNVKSATYFKELCVHDYFRNRKQALADVDSSSK